MRSALRAVAADSSLQLLKPHRGESSTFGFDPGQATVVLEDRRTLLEGLAVTLVEASHCASDVRVERLDIVVIGHGQYSEGIRSVVQERSASVITQTRAPDSTGSRSGVKGKT